MPVLWIPAALRRLTHGEESVVVAGRSLRAILEEADNLYPGIRRGLCDGDRLRPGLALVVNNQFARADFETILPADAEIHVIPAIAGG